MLTRLTISNIVLIDKLNLEFGRELNILTGETGAGKSILLDALALALGARSDVGLVRHGTDMASVVAEFDSYGSDVINILNETGIDCEETLILRRTLSADGKSHAWINDVPVSVRILKSVGNLLLEIHGQFANHALLDPTTHRMALDNFGIKNIDGFKTCMTDVAAVYNNYSSAKKKLLEVQEFIDKNIAEQEYLEHNIAELRALNVTPGEESELAARRTDMMNAEKNASILADAVAAIGRGGDTLDAQIFTVAHILERIKGDSNPYSEQIDKLYSAAEIVATVAEQITPSEIDKDTIDAVEERLFAIRAAARKHHVASDELPQKLVEMESQLNTITNSDEELKKLKNIVATAHETYLHAASKLTEYRTRAATELRTRLLQELPDLKLKDADFNVVITPHDPSINGVDEIVFMIKTNPGMPFAPLHKAASGGELARLMLAMRVVLADENKWHTFVFDEVDTGISGATASAVGSRLNRLAHESQALVITHSAQVAGFADKHFKIEKTSDGLVTTTNVREITGKDRLNEVARIISGAEITPESIATAKTLIK